MTQKLWLIAAPSQSTQILSDLSTRDNRSANFCHALNIDQTIIPLHNVIRGAKIAHMALVVEIGDCADAPRAVPPFSNYIEIGVDMFQYLGADDRVVIASIRLRIKCIRHRKQLRMPRAGCRILNAHRTEIESAINAARLLQNYLCQKAVAGSDLEHRPTAVFVDRIYDLTKQGIV